MLEYKPRKLGSNLGTVIYLFSFSMACNSVFQCKQSMQNAMPKAFNFQKEGEVLPPSPVIFYYAPYNSVIYFAQRAYVHID